MLLHGRLGIVVANLVSTSLGMTVSFVANGRYTFHSRLTARGAALFALTTGTTLWLVQPLLIAALLRLPWPGPPGADVLAAKPGATAACVMLNFLACRHVVWRPPVRSDRRP